MICFHQSDHTIMHFQSYVMAFKVGHFKMKFDSVFLNQQKSKQYKPLWAIKLNFKALKNKTTHSFLPTNNQTINYRWSVIQVFVTDTLHIMFCSFYVKHTHLTLSHQLSDCFVFAALFCLECLMHTNTFYLDKNKLPTSGQF